MLSLVRSLIGSLGFFRRLEVDFWPRQTGLVFELDLLELKKTGISTLILDLDNTLIEPGLGKLDPRVRNWLKKALELKLKLLVLTNNRNSGYLKTVREEFTRTSLKLEIIDKAAKPSTKKALKAIEKLKLKLPQDRAGICIVGDQFRTDILLAKLLKVKSAFVKPLKKEGRLFQTLRKLDRFFFLKRL